MSGFKEATSGGGLLEWPLTPPQVPRFGDHIGESGSKPEAHRRERFPRRHRRATEHLRHIGVRDGVADIEHLIDPPGQRQHRETESA